ncbi:DUF3558 domain-containing protein [Nocardia sp. NEAU-G5]|uniref:DUF3558 domain-containing protein n=1 Tax=Nocardia albiluteola TaxID=2842303 RepID=A0ABS6AV93_9NOCA|nr:DUF3558 domain-containing protein [Nocardia albiluteola]MBU3060944.1 DUF3558 domain-containing protein [Nocardia albiluteola]
MTQRSKTLSVVALTAAAGLTLAGCGKTNTGSPTSAAQTTTASSSAAAATTTASDSAVKQWDPCTIPDSAASGLGLNATSKTDQIAGTTFDGWKTCGWQANDKTYTFEMFTSSHTLSEYKQRTDYEGFTPITVGSHQGLQYHAVGQADIDCSISLQVTGGTVDFEVVNQYGKPGLGEPCATVHRLADGLAQYLPGT